MSAKDVKRNARGLYKRWRLRYGTGTAHLVVALDTDFATAEKKLARIKASSGGTLVVATNSIDPISLRRAGYKYAWLNMQTLDTPHALRRQILNFFMVWRPCLLTFL